MSLLPSERYLLILSDGEYYEPRCLLLPNLNYLVNSSELRKGSIIRLERFNLNKIIDGKILVIEDLTVIKNTLTNGVKINDNECKSIMSNNLAEILKSIDIIGSLKPTSNNKQIKLKNQPQQGKALTTIPIKTTQEREKIDLSTLINQNTNNNNIYSSKYELIELKVKINKGNKSTDKNNNKNKFKENKDPNQDDDLEEKDYNELREEVTQYEEEEYDEYDELDYEEENENEENKIEKTRTVAKDTVDIILCKCNSCKDQNTLKLCYKLLGLNENSSLEQVHMCYSKLTSIDSNLPVLDLKQTQKSNLINETEHSSCDLDKLIRNLLKRKMIIIDDTDRREIRAKAYYLILSSYFFFFKFISLTNILKFKIKF